MSSLTQNVPKNYLKYHHETNKAEELISNNHFEEALDLYGEVFNSYDFVFLRDYKIAAQLALYLDDKEQAFQIIQKGIASGWDLKSLKKHKYLSKLQNDPRWKLIEEKYPELRNQYLTRIDDSTRMVVQKMYKKDQRKALGALFRIGDKAQKKYALQKFAPHSEVQLNQLSCILKTHGYPGEQLIGNDFWVSTILSHHNSISSDYAKTDTLYTFIKPLLQAAIQTGQMSPYEYAMMEDWRIAVSSDRSETGYGFLNPPRDFNLIETNRQRKAIGLRSVELRNQLVDIEKQTGMNLYLPDWISGKIEVIKD